ncbi:MAG TPA: rhomboid family intramembrane serine protease [candidate division Zixibacteria bacterium]|nr:rhomboid family intramembrane serine protease [candidate division Zixibacteria bacterium]
MQSAPRPEPPSLYSRLRRSPTFYLILANVAVYIAITASGASPINPSVDVLLRWGANSGGYTVGGEWWRLVTSMFLHGGIVHLALNMWALLNLGLLAELLFGDLPFIGMYFACGICGSLASLCWRGESVAVGASGAIFGIAGALLPALALHPNLRVRRALRSQLGSIALFVFYNLVFGAGAAGIDNAAHVGGLVCGIILGAILPTVRSGTAAGRKLRDVAAVLISIALFAGGAFGAMRNNRASVALRRASDAAQAGDFQQALRFANQAAASAPDNARAQYLLGMVHLEAKQPELAIAPLERATKLRSDWGPAFGQLCLAQAETGDAKSAIPNCVRAAQLDPKNSAEYFNLGLTYQQDKQYTAAAEAFRRAAALNPEGVDENYSLGIALLQAGKLPDAVDPLSKAVRLDPKNANARRALVHALTVTGRDLEAAEIARGKTP